MTEYTATAQAKTTASPCALTVSALAQFPTLGKSSLTFGKS